MKKNFTAPVMHVIEIDNADVICSSSCPRDAHGTVCLEDFSCPEDL